MENRVIVATMILYGGSNFQKRKANSKDKYYNCYQKDIIDEIVNSLIEKKKLVLLNNIKISSICQDHHIPNVLMLELTKP